MSRVQKPVTQVVPEPSTDVIRDKFATTRNELNRSLIERETEIDLTLVALLSQESVLLIGPPGTAKSMLCEAVANWVSGDFFSYLLTKYTEPNEIFGPYDLQGYKAGVYTRLVSGYLPTADVVFLDEVFKASSSILNTLLRAINERKYRNGTSDLKIPLRVLIGASNEIPPPENMKELHAVFDRFVLRHEIKATLTRSGRHRLLALPKITTSTKISGPSSRDHTPRLSTTLTLDELDTASNEALSTPWSDEAEQALDQILDELQAQGIIPTQRRQWKSVRIVQAAAWLASDDAVHPEHLEILQDVLWDDPGHTKAAREIIGKIANPAGMEINGLIAEIDETLSKMNPDDLGSQTRAVARLGEISRKFKNFGTNAKAKAGLDMAKREILRIKIGAIDAVDR